MNPNRLVTVVLLVISMVVGGVATGEHIATTAVVQPAAFHTCTNGQGCVYSEANGGGSVLHIIFSQSGGACVNMPTGWNDVASSAELKFGSGFGMAWYKNAGCTGPRFLQPALTDTNFVDDDY